MKLTLTNLLTAIGIWMISSSCYAQKSADTTMFTRFRLGSYGEVLYQHMDYGADRYSNADGAQPTNRSAISIPRMVLALDYWFTRDISFSTEIEFEHGGTGNAMELEYDEMGEYEMETEHGGEVVLEQFHLTRRFNDAVQLRIGHMIVPVGMTNNRHLPIEFFGTVRPEGEDAMLPLTWHETGIALFGRIKRWNYEMQVVNGLDANGFSSANWVKGGQQGIFEGSKMTSPAFVARIDNRSIPMLRISTSAYYGNSCKNTSEPEKMGDLDGTVSIISADAEYNNQRLIARAGFVQGNLSDSYSISSINRNISSNSQFARTPVASEALTWSGEVGFDVLSLIDTREKLFPFARYEHYNTMAKTEGGILADNRFDRNVLTVGLNYYMLPNLALKLDYSMRSIDNGNYNQENTLGMALVYTAWFVEK
jgi:hypothetical protein